MCQLAPRHPIYIYIYIYISSKKLKPALRTTQPSYSMNGGGIFPEAKAAGA